MYDVKSSRTDARSCCYRNHMVAKVVTSTPLASSTHIQFPRCRRMAPKMRLVSVCHLHFKTSEVLWETSYYHERSARLLTAPLAKPKLSGSAIPSIFPACSSDLPLGSSRSTSSLPPEKQRKLVTRKHPKTPPGPKNAPEELLELTFIKEEPSTSDNEVAHYEPTFVDVSAPSTIEDGPFIKSEPPETITAESPDETFSKYSEPTCTQSPQEVQLCMTSKNNSASNTSLRPSESALEPPPLVLLSKSSPHASISEKSTEQRNPKKKRNLQEANDGNETLPIFHTDVPEAEVRVRVAELQVEQMKKEYEAKMKNQQIIAEQFKKEHEAKMKEHEVKMKEHEAKMKEHELKMKKVKGQIVEMEFRCQEMMKQSVIENKVHELTVMDLEQKLSTSQIIHELTIQELKQKLYNSQLEQQILEKRLNAHPS